MTEIEKKATGWKAYYQGGQWVEEQAKPKAAKKAPAKKTAPKKTG